MRASPVLRAITMTVTLTLAVAVPVAAQENLDTRFPAELGEDLLSAAMVNVLDGSDYNELVVRTARAYQGNQLGGKTTEPETPKNNSKNARQQVARGGWITFAPFADTDAVTQQVLDTVGQTNPDLIIVSGGDWRSNVGIARRESGTFIIDLAQPLPCLTETGQPDLTGVCAGTETQAPGNYLPMEFAVEEAAYVAGAVAAHESRNGRLGIISGSSDCLECDRYVTGFTNGARSVEPEIDIELAYLADDEVAGFGDEASARVFTEAFVDVYQPDVLLPIGRGATMGMVEAACEAGIKVIGAGLDIQATRPQPNDCIMASITRDTSRAIEEAMFRFAEGNSPAVVTYDLAGGGVALTDEWRLSPTKRVDTDEFFADAERAIVTDQVEACPEGCGVFAPGTGSEAAGS